MDFTSSKKIRQDIHALKNGYDHNWVLSNKGDIAELAASLYHDSTGILMQVYTTTPGLQLYSGNFLDGKLQHTKKNNTAHQHAGVCLEAQFFPDSPNQASFPCTILKPGGQYLHKTFYKFSVQDAVSHLNYQR